MPLSAQRLANLSRTAGKSFQSRLQNFPKPSKSFISRLEIYIFKLEIYIFRLEIYISKLEIKILSGIGGFFEAL